MKKITVLITIIVTVMLAGCARVTIQHGEDKATWTSLEPFRTRSTHVEYNPETKMFTADLKREQAITPDMVNAAVQAGAAAAAVASKGGI